MYLFHEEHVENIYIMDACSKSILGLIGQTLFFFFFFFQRFFCLFILISYTENITNYL